MEEVRGIEPGTADDVADLRKQLHLVHRELGWVRTEQEHQAEALARLRRRRAALLGQVDSISEALAQTLSAAYWADQRPNGLLRRRPAKEESDMVREVEACPWFDGGWYLRRNASAVRKRTSPALHYVRRRQNADPGPHFSVVAYLSAHPEAPDAGLPLLVHAARNGWLADGARTAEGVESTRSTADIHL